MCPKCGTQTVNRIFCINCYTIFEKTSKNNFGKVLNAKYKNQPVSSLQKKQTSLERNFRFIVIFIFQLFFLIPLITHLLIFLNISVLYDIFDSIVIFILISLLIINNRISYTYITRNIIEKDIQTRIRLSLIKYKSNFLQLVSDADFSRLKTKFSSQYKKLKPTLLKIKLHKRYKIIYVLSFCLMLVISLFFFIFGYPEYNK
jgi:hypothetical protein